MGKLTGLVMIAAGVGAAAYAYPLLGTPDTGEKQLAEVVAIATPGATQIPKQNNAQATPKSAPTVRISAAETAAKQAPSTSPSAPIAALPVLQPAPASAAVIAAPQPTLVVRPIEPPVPLLAKRNKADEERQQLARDIQRELKRVGCLQSDPDGSWNSATRAAMKTFIDRVNATLPTDEPDHILKTLVQGHPGNACGKSCSVGQTTSTDGRCLPTAVIAQAPAPTAAKRPDAAKPAQFEASAPQKRTETASVPEPKAEASPSASSWQATTRPASSGQTSSGVAPPALAAVTVASTTDTKRAADLPGRMSVGAAPQTEPPVSTFKPDAEAATSKIVLKPKTRQDSERPEQPERREKAEVEKPERKPERASGDSARRPPAPRVAAYRAPPPRYVGAYSPPRQSSSRPRFGPQVFRQLEASGR